MPIPTLCLSAHAGFLCRHSGACCSSGWPIPVEAPLLARLRAALAEGRLQPAVGTGPGPAPFVETDGLPSGASAILRVEPSGACPFHDGVNHRCLIRSRLGHDLLPASCQHFPRVCVTDDDSVRMTLSHYCPTVADMAFDHAQPLAIVRAPASLVNALALEGLDARGAWPPLLRPNMLMDRAAYRTWERNVVSELARPAAAETALARIAAATERLRGWRPGGPTLGEAVAAAFAVRDGPDGAGDAVVPSLGPDGVDLDRMVRRAVPAPLAVPLAAPDAPQLFARHVAPAWMSFAETLRRYLAAKAFANWCAYQGSGLRTVVWSVVAALAVVKVESAGVCGKAGRQLDAALLREALRASDLLLVHLASREALARGLAEIEAVPGTRVLDAL